MKINQSLATCLTPISIIACRIRIWKTTRRAQQAAGPYSTTSNPLDSSPHQRGDKDCPDQHWNLESPTVIFSSLSTVYSKAKTRKNTLAPGSVRIDQTDSHHSNSPAALWKTYSLPLTVSTPSLSVHFLLFGSVNGETD